MFPFLLVAFEVTLRALIDTTKHRCIFDVYATLIHVLLNIIYFNVYVLLNFTIGYGFKCVIEHLEVKSWKISHVNLWWTCKVTSEWEGHALRWNVRGLIIQPRLCSIDKTVYQKGADQYDAQDTTAHLIILVFVVPEVSHHRHGWYIVFWKIILLLLLEEILRVNHNFLSQTLTFLLITFLQFKACLRLWAVTL